LALGGAGTGVGHLGVLPGDVGRCSRSQALDHGLDGLGEAVELVAYLLGAFCQVVGDLAQPVRALLKP